MLDRLYDGRARRSCRRRSTTARARGAQRTVQVRRDSHRRRPSSAAIAFVCSRRVFEMSKALAVKAESSFTSPAWPASTARRSAARTDFDDRGPQEGHASSRTRQRHVLSRTIEGVGQAPYQPALVQPVPRPKPPFTTSTPTSRSPGPKLSIDASDAMTSRSVCTRRASSPICAPTRSALSMQAITAARGAGGLRCTARRPSPLNPRVYRSNSKNAQEAHEAIRPSGSSSARRHRCPVNWTATSSACTT